MVLIVELHFLRHCLTLELSIAVRHLPLMGCVLILGSHHTDLVVHFIELLKSLLISFGLRVSLRLLLSSLSASKVAWYCNFRGRWLSSTHCSCIENLSLT